MLKLSVKHVYTPHPRQMDAAYTEILPGLFWLGPCILRVSADLARILDLGVLLTDQTSATAQALGFKYLLRVDSAKQAAQAALKLYYRLNRVGVVMEGASADDLIRAIAGAVVPGIDEDTRDHIVATFGKQA